MRSIAAAAAALALVAGTAHAQGNSKGNGGHGNGGHDAGASMQGGGHGKAERGNSDRGNGGGHDDRGNGRGPDSRTVGEARVEPGHAGGGQGRGHDAARAVSGNRGQGNGNRGHGNDNADRGRSNGNRTVAIDDRERAAVEHDIVRVRDLSAIPPRRVVTGCPPGLAKKNPPCVPPGQARSRFNGYDRPGFWGLRLDDGRYRYGDGYLLRLDPDGRIGGYVPLLGGALGVGNLWPSYYEPVALPSYYESYYGLGPNDSYRYADNVIYQVDPATAAITSIAALLTGDTFTVGQPVPPGYDVYNVPYAYRDRYYDRPDAYYRYSDGYVYQVDPQTRLIAAAIELLAS